jgi:transposase-like protein
MLADLLEFDEPLPEETLPTCLADALELVQLPDREFLRAMSDLGIINNLNTHYLCPKCNSPMYLQYGSYSTNGASWICSERTCHSRRAIKYNSLLEFSGLRLKKSYLIFSCWCASLSIQMATQIVKDVSYNVIRLHYFHLRRKAMELYETDLLNEPLGGDNHIVQVDESAFGRAKYNRGSALKRRPLWVLGLRDDVTRRIVMQIVPKRDANTLEPIILANVRPDSVVHTDQWAAYNGLKDYIPHETVNHSIEFKSSSGVHTNGIEGEWSGAKKFMEHYSVHNRASIQSYLGEYCYKRNVAPTFLQRQQMGKH